MSMPSGHVVTFTRAENPPSFSHPKPIVLFPSVPEQKATAFFAYFQIGEYRVLIKWLREVESTMDSPTFTHERMIVVAHS